MTHTVTELFRDTLQFRADVEAIGRVHDVFDDLATNCNEIPEQLRSGFELALVEVVTNVVKHIENNRPTNITLLIRATSDHVEAVVTDNAPPLNIDLGSVRMPNPHQLAESGRGLALVTLLVERFEHEPLIDGNRWTLTAKLK